MGRLKKRPKSTPRRGPGRVRIIAGDWRHRWLAIPPNAEIRPTPDRVRETLFNWLAANIKGAHCLDLFAGTGALGFESVSRGAAWACLVEQNRYACESMNNSVAAFNTDAVNVVQANVLQWLSGAPQEFDIVFVDPPFGSGCYTAVLDGLAQGWLKRDAYIYVESPIAEPLNELPSGWTCFREAATAQVAYRVFQSA